MTVKDILQFLETVAPISTAAEFDNVGLLIGDETAEVKGILCSLDCFSEVVDRAEDLGANLIITHHPVIFEPLRAINKGDIAYRLVKSGISVISMHTNLDIAEGGVNDALCEKIGLYDVKPVTTHDGFLIKQGLLYESENPYDFARHLKESLGGSVKFVAGSNDVLKVAVCSGSGGNYLQDAIDLGADAFVTGDVKHHVFIEAGEHNISLYDAGHFNTEDVIIAPLVRDLAAAFPEIPILECHFSKIESV